jgi:acetoin utilization deacetylase AcuC-like enzyme
VLIVDWDVHHGNGTQHAFEEDPSVLFFSIHQFPHFPGTGLFTETGIGAGEGYTVNIPLSGGYGPGDYVSLFDRALRPLADEFKPDLILVSAGFDIHPSDPLGGLRVNAEGFSALTRIMMEIADATCRGRLVCSLEGGYDLESLGSCVRAVLRELAGLSICDVPELLTDVNEKRVNYALQRLGHVHRHFWQCFR